MEFESPTSLAVAGSRPPSGSRLGPTLRLGRSWVVRLADERGSANRRLTWVIAIVVGWMMLASSHNLREAFPLGVDVEIPLRAAAHWSAGAPVYPPSAMQVAYGPDLPYLYPPFLLPLLSPIASLPREPVIDTWLVMCVLAAVWTCRRLGIPWIAVPCMLVWPPFGEGLVVGNVQIFLFAAFVAVFYEPGASWAGAPNERELRPSRDLPNGILATLVGALKFVQVLPLLYLARRRIRAALMGVAVVGAVALTTLPVTGLAIYGDWLAQLNRASNPAWITGGMGLVHHYGIPDLLLLAIGMAIALVLRGRDSVAWLGLALVVATPSVHGFTFLFLLPALLTIRRDIAIPIGALYLIYYSVPWWLAWFAAVFLLAAARRWPRLRAPGAPEVRPGAASGPAFGCSSVVARWPNLWRARSGRAAD